MVVVLLHGSLQKAIDKAIEIVASPELAGPRLQGLHTRTLALFGDACRKGYSGDRVYVVLRSFCGHSAATRRTLRLRFVRSFLSPRNQSAARRCGEEPHAGWLGLLPRAARRCRRPGPAAGGLRSEVNNFE